MRIATVTKLCELSPRILEQGLRGANLAPAPFIHTSSHRPERTVSEMARPPLRSGAKRSHRRLRLTLPAVERSLAPVPRNQSIVSTVESIQARKHDSIVSQQVHYNSLSPIFCIATCTAQHHPLLAHPAASTFAGHHAVPGHSPTNAHPTPTKKPKHIGHWIQYPAVSDRANSHARSGEKILPPVTMLVNP